MNKRIAILTGGGDVPGLNMCLKSLVYSVIDLGFEALGVRKGWEGFISYNPNDPSTFTGNFIELSKSRVRAIDHTSGSFLHSSRLDPRRTPSRQLPSFLHMRDEEAHDLSDHIISAIEHLDLYALIVLGDDDMLRYAVHLRDRGVPIIAIPKTIHNNIYGTDYTLGFSTGLARGVSFVHELRGIASSREQVVVVETFGNHSGYSALLMAYLAGVDRVLIPEVQYDPQVLAYLVKQDKRTTPSNYALVSVTNGSRIAPDKLEAVRPFLAAHSYQQVSEQAATDNGPGRRLQSSGLIAAELLQNLTGEEVFFQQLTYLMRTGAPDGQDLLGATNFALTAARLAQQGQFGRMTAFQREHTWTHVDLGLCIAGEKLVDIDAWYDSQSYKPTEGLIWAANGFSAATD